MGTYRARPDWQALVFQRGLALLVALKLLEGLAAGRWALYGGELFPWGRQVAALAALPPAAYWGLCAAQAALAALLFAGVRPRLCAGLLAGALALDTLNGLQNHRLLLTLSVALLALGRPVPRDAARAGYLGQRVYWNLDVQGRLVALVYLSTALHKLNPNFLSGEALWAITWHVQQETGRYPEALYALLQRQEVCQALALVALTLELALAALLPFARTCGWAIPAAIAMHLAFSLVMPWIWVFTGLMVLSQLAFLPTRTLPGTYVLTDPGRAAALLARLAWPGAVRLEAADGASGATLLRPDGSVARGYEAWCELLALSPVTCLLAETARIPPARWLGRRLVG